jgi:hypothetical protein
MKVKSIHSDKPHTECTDNTQKEEFQFSGNSKRKVCRSTLKGFHPTQFTIS